MSSGEAARQRILAVYPQAYAKQIGRGLYRIYDGKSPNNVIDPGTYSTPGAAWIAAAKHLGERVAMDIRELLNDEDQKST